MKDLICYFSENYEWILGLTTLLLGIISLFLIKLYLPWKKERKAKNIEIYETYLTSKYQDLFEIEFSEDFNMIQLVSKGFNPSEISKFCYRVIDFKEKGNKFFGMSVSFRFYRLYVICKTINSSIDNVSEIKSVFHPDEFNYQFLSDNMKNFEILKKRFKNFFIIIYGNI